MADDTTEAFPLSDGGAGVPEPAETPPEIEGYRIMGLLGRGGMSTVWRAVQQSTQREVALKVLGWGLAGLEKTRRRFEREVELASRLAHPCIARVYESGLYHGAYYYAMELVEGVPLDEYVGRHSLGTGQILELMRAVCRAVQHAHQRGVIHRDLKPSNVLVTEDGQPHVLDFGLAKAYLDEGAALTISVGGDVLGTPAYMSPEQAAGKSDQVDTRSDVYSLGVILYRLVTGVFPHDLSADRQEVLRRIAQEEPRRPCGVAKDIDKELEAILLKALALGPDDRYASAGELADDIDRYLKGDPVAAKAPTVGYFLRKRLRKHRIAVAVGCSVLLAMSAVAVVAYVRIAQARDEARLEARKARMVTDFFNETLAPDDVGGGAGREVTVHSVLDRAARQIGTKFSAQPLLEAEIRQCLGLRYMALEDHDAAHAQTSLALGLWQRHLGAEHPNTLAAMHQLANILGVKKRASEAEQLHREVLQARVRILGEDSPDTLRSMNDLAMVQADQERYDEAEKLQKRVIEAAQRVLGKEHSATLIFMKDLACTLWNQGKRGEAEVLYRQVVQIRRRVFGEEDLSTLSSMRDLANALWDQGKRREALALYRRLAEVCRRALGPSSTVTLRSARTLGDALSELVWSDKEHISDSREPEPGEALSSKDVLDALVPLDDVARALSDLYKHHDAELLHRWALEVRQMVLGNEHADTLMSKDSLADDLHCQGSYQSAELLHREVLGVRQQALGNEHVDTLASEERLADDLRWQRKYDEAERLYKHVLDGRRRSLGKQHSLTLRVRKSLVLTLEAQGKKAEVGDSEESPPADETAPHPLERERAALAPSP